MNEHLKPDEIEMLSRAEKATKKGAMRDAQASSLRYFVNSYGSTPLWEVDHLCGARACRVWEEGWMEPEFKVGPPRGDGWKEVTRAEARSRFPQAFLYETAELLMAAPSDLPTVLARLANEREKLAIAIREIEKAATELRLGLPPQYAGVDREGLPIEVEHSSAEITCGMVAMGLDAALARINELEKQS